MRIMELSRRTGKHPITLRRLEKRGLLAPRRDVNGWRVFDESAVDAVKKLYVKDEGAGYDS